MSDPEAYTPEFDYKKWQEELKRIQEYIGFAATRHEYERKLIEYYEQDIKKNNPD